MVSVRTENISCRENGMMIYTAKSANQAATNNFLGHLKEANNIAQNNAGVKYDCCYIIHDQNTATCDFVYLALSNVPDAESKLCGIDFS